MNKNNNLKQKENKNSDLERVLDSNHKQSGFTLLEMLMVIAIIGILAAFAAPRLQNAVAKARFAQVITAVTPVQKAVEVCLITNTSSSSGAESGDKTSKSCASGKNGVPAKQETIAGNLPTVSVDESGKITATNADKETYIVIPTTAGTQGVIWTVDGTCVTSGLCDARLN